LSGASPTTLFEKARQLASSLGFDARDFDIVDARAQTHSELFQKEADDTLLQFERRNARWGDGTPSIATPQVSAAFKDLMGERYAAQVKRIQDLSGAWMPIAANALSQQANDRYQKLANELAALKPVQISAGEVAPPPTPREGAQPPAKR
jgi:hypothetical protein